MPFEVQLTALSPEVGLGLLVAFGLIAGCVNTIAGGGSLLALPLLMFLGVPPVVANGTIRVSVLAQNVSAVATFARRRIIDPALVVRFAPVMLVGSGCGAWAATRLSNEMMKPVVGAALAVWAVFLVVKPGSFLKPPGEPKPLTVPLYVGAFAVGLYGGFLQAGVGFPMLALLVAGVGFDAVRANAAKVALVGGVHARLTADLRLRGARRVARGLRARDRCLDRCGDRCAPPDEGGRGPRALGRRGHGRRIGPSP